MPHRCVKHCEREFPSARGLSTHQKTCGVYRKSKATNAESLRKMLAAPSLKGPKNVEMNRIAATNRICNDELSLKDLDYPNGKRRKVASVHEDLEGPARDSEKPPAPDILHTGTSTGILENGIQGPTSHRNTVGPSWQVRIDQSGTSNEADAQDADSDWAELIDITQNNSPPSNPQPDHAVVDGMGEGIPSPTRIQGDSHSETAPRPRPDSEEVQGIDFNLDVTIVPEAIVPEAQILGRGCRRKPGLPRRFRDELPAAPPRIQKKTKENPNQEGLPSIPVNEAATGSESSTLENPSPGSKFSPPPLEVFRTEPNSFGIYREYIGRPTHDPDEFFSVEEVSEIQTRTYLEQDNAPGPHHNDEDIPSPLPEPPWFAPCKSASAYRMLDHSQNSSVTKSQADMQRIVDEVILAPDFNAKDLVGFDINRELRRLDDPPPTITIDDLTSSPQSGWKQSSVPIPIPDGNKRSGWDDIVHFDVNKLATRRIINLVVDAFQDEDASKFHLTPFREYFQPSCDSTPQRIFGETYTTDEHIKSHEEVNALPREPDDNYERVVVSLMLWSDSTQLAQFGSASLWPIYLYFGNQSKYSRASPTEQACHHLAYLPKLPEDEIQQFWNTLTGNDGLSDETITHCRRELIHAILRMLLKDEEFQNAYREGILVKCWDGMVRRLFPRLFSYSADYPELVLLSSIKSLSRFPCPRCLVPKTEASEFGMARNTMKMIRTMRVDDENHRHKIQRAREFVYLKGYGVKSKAVEDMIGDKSLVPIKNAFSDALSHTGFNYFQMFPVDVLHDFEIGVWKAVYLHLLRILVAETTRPNLIIVLNKRFRMIPTFARDTIRKFSASVSAMTQPTGHQFEDILQCAIPAFEGLLPEPHNEIVLVLLFTMATWHGLAKLRLHTEDTITIFKDATTALGYAIRRFKRVTCEVYHTREIDTKSLGGKKSKSRYLGVKRGTLGSAKGKRGKAKAFGDDKELEAIPDIQLKGTKKKELNLSTAKVHKLAHYPYDISRFGSLDNTTTQTGELQHRVVKRNWARTNKNNALQQMTNLDRRARILRMISRRDPYKTQKSTKYTKSKIDLRNREDRPPKTDPSMHYHIPKTYAKKYTISKLLHDNEGDPALTTFFDRFRDHLISRVTGRDFDGDEHEYLPIERTGIRIKNDELYEHKTLQVNYTSYDGRRGQDYFNPRTHYDVMLLGREEEDDRNSHPFWYARIIKIFSVTFRFVAHGSDAINADLQTMHVLWVRWFGRDPGVVTGWAKRKLHTIGFVPEEDVAAFGFLDPDQIVRGVHLIPAFHDGQTSTLLGPSIVRNTNDKDEDWERYYVNFFADRDMLMRYMGTGIGHGKIRQQFADIMKIINNKPRSDITVDEFEEDLLSREIEDQTEDSPMTAIQNNDVNFDSEHELDIDESNPFQWDSDDGMDAVGLDSGGSDEGEDVPGGSEIDSGEELEYA